MKILCVGDIHMRLELPYASAFKDGRRSEWEAIKKTIHDTAKSCNAIILLGDILNSKHNNSNVLRELIEFLKMFGEKEIHLLVGNHSRYGTHTALDFLDKIKHKNWFVYSEPQVTTVAGLHAMMIPFMTPALLGVETKEEGIGAIIKRFPPGIVKIPLAFVHHGISGANVHESLVDRFNEIILPQEVMEKHFDHTFFGHIHAKQKLSESVIGTGNIFTNEIGEYEKSIWTWEDGIVNEVSLPVREIHKIIWEARDDKEIIPSNSIVKCYVINRETNLKDVKEYLSFYDASIIIEQYPSTRTKVHFEDGGLDLSVDGLLKLYAEEKKLSYEDLKEGFLLIK